MKILFLTRRFYPDIGGVEKHVYEVSKKLIARGHQVLVVTEQNISQNVKKDKNYHSVDQSDTQGIKSKKPTKSSQSVLFEVEKIKILCLNVGQDDWFKKFRIWADLIKNIKHIRDADIIHCHDVFFWYLPFRFFFPNKKVFTTFHGYETKFPPTVRSKIVRKISEGLSFGNICVGDYIKKWYGTKTDFVTYGGVEIQISQPKAGPPLAEKIKTFEKVRILLFGRLEEDNGAKIYLEALKLLKQRGITYSLIVCGEGKYKSQFSKFGEIKGLVNPMSKYIDRADIIFVSSYLSILEAISRGKIVFSVFQNKLKKDYLNSSPFSKFIILAANGRELVDKLSALRSRSNLAYNLTTEGRKWANTQTWDKVVDTYLNLWKK